MRGRRGSAPPRRYDGQIAVVTGASAGLGRRFAVDLAHRGATVIGLARRAELLDATVHEMRTVASASSAVVCDVGDAVGYQAALAEIEAEHDRVDILINNA